MENQASNQFSIQRLFWTLIVASVIFKLADMTGIVDAFSSSWKFARGNGQVGVIISVIILSLVVMVYIGWIGLRLPWLIEQSSEIRKKRAQRRKQLLRELESRQK
ncbi:hypothetical protein [Mariniblastus fucicola]|uniref:Lipopolysaccharide assembly protein A domain-containing protein n=1 Tax=Mariniblastus fucicola TaxID=980251 RepID=A0A5B9P1G7_9BACT|nr:hypothetical protein [Mariniblastus fucicola]QEG20158.1 hypothetical protein MFFC18_00050 [Mariniblastus fucicola]